MADVATLCDEAEENADEDADAMSLALLCEVHSNHRQMIQLMMIENEKCTTEEERSACERMRERINEANK